MNGFDEFKESQIALSKLTEAFSVIKETRQDGYIKKSEHLDLVFLIANVLREIGGIPTCCEFDDEPTGKMDRLIDQANKKFIKVDEIRRKEDGNRPRRTYKFERKLTPDETKRLRKIFADPNQFFDVAGLAEKYQVTPQTIVNVRHAK